MPGAVRRQGEETEGRCPRGEEVEARHSCYRSEGGVGELAMTAARRLAEVTTREEAMWSGHVDLMQSEQEEKRERAGRTSRRD